MNIEDLLLRAMASGASDVFVTAGKAPAMRHGGEVAVEADDPVSGAEIDAFRRKLLSERAEAQYLERGSFDAAFALGDAQRFRLNFLSSFNGPALVARPIHSGADLFFAELGLPDGARQLCEEPRGLILIAGAAGSGKSTTLAAMVNHINLNCRKHIISIEDPIEYLHADRLAVITQREIDSGVISFADALRSAMRESPDVIVIGEMRDLETMQVAINAALTGHLVISTVHTGDAVQAVERIVNLGPDHQREQIADDLGMALLGILAQRLLPRQDRGGMIPAVEVLIGTPLVKKLIGLRDFEGLDEAIRGGGESGMINFTRSIFKLMKSGLISAAAAEAAVGNRDEFQLLVKGMERSVDAFRRKAGDGSVNPDFVDMRRLLRSAVRIGASDLLLSVGASPQLRVNGELRALDLPVQTGGDTQRQLYSLLSPRQRVEFEETREIDFAMSVELDHEDGKKNFRFRINGFFQRGNVGVAVRVVPDRIPEPRELHLPEALVSLLDKGQGLILVTGPTGSGKSTTLASLIGRLNATRGGHIITVEDPIEYVHENQLALIEQREVHADTLSFASALKYALRQDPDVIMVGEMRDIDTIAAALTAAETGHLVLATLHTNSAPQTLDRIVDSFPAYHQNQIRQQLAGVLLAVVSQRLLPTRDGKGRIAAFELMIGTPPVRALIRDGKTSQLQSVMETSSKDGMITMERALTELYSRGLVSAEEVQRLSGEYKQIKSF